MHVEQRNENNGASRARRKNSCMSFHEKKERNAQKYFLRGVQAPTLRSLWSQDNGATKFERNSKTQ
eukprot:2999061-Karenia_brevis.AAC.1